MEKPSRSGVLFGVDLLGCLVLTAILRLAFQNSPPPRFADPYLVGVVILAYKASTRWALLLLTIVLGLNVYLLAPLDTVDFLQLLSFALLAILVIWITGALRTGAARRSS